MHKQPRISPLVTRLLTGCLAILGAVAAASCGSIDSASNSLVSMLTPYRMEVVQGNFVSKEQAELIQPGMSRGQVRTILGTPLLVDIFHADRWDYVFSIKRQGIESLERRITVYFEGDSVASVEVPQDLLTEEEFVHYLDANVKDEDLKMPVLQATPEQLERAAAQAQAYRERAALRAENVPQQSNARPASYYPPLDMN